jgi:hypothetical protein
LKEEFDQFIWPEIQDYWVTFASALILCIIEEIMKKVLF